jgi:hypothetical protein
MMETKVNVTARQEAHSALLATDMARPRRLVGKISAM